MKKLMFAIAAVAAGTVLADVTSANVVGYYNLSIPAGQYKLVALNMQKIDTTKHTLDELFPYKEGMGASTAAAEADQIQVWDYENQTYRFFYMYKRLSKGVLDPKSYHWVEDVDSNPLADVAITAGDSVFYCPIDDIELSVPGQVPNAAKGILKPGYNMISVAYPIDWNPNDAGTTFWNDSKFACSTASAEADQIQIWDNDLQTYRFFFLYKRLSKGVLDPKSYHWVEDADGNEVWTTKISVSDGFFYYSQGDIPAEGIPFNPLGL